MGKNQDQRDPKTRKSIRRRKREKWHLQKQMKQKRQKPKISTSGATDDESANHTGTAFRVRIVRAAKTIGEDDTQTLIAARNRKSVGWKQAFFCDSGADVSLVTEAKARRDKMPIDT